MKKILFGFLSLFLLIGCESESTVNDQVEEETPSDNVDVDEESSDDDSQEEDNEDENSIEMQREAFYDFLIQNSSKIWKIESALLENSNGTFDIIQSNHIQDDEFVFVINADSGSNAFNGQLTWKRRKGVNFEFDNIASLENDLYSSPSVFEFTINQEAIINNPEFQFYLDEDSIINGKVLSNNSEALISIKLVEKSEEDYKMIPGSLNFQNFATFPNIESINNATGFKSSYTSNSIYLSYRSSPNSFNATRKVFKYSFEGQTLDSVQIALPNLEFTYSRFHIRNDRLIVFGSAHISELDLFLNEEPNTVTTGLDSNLAGADLAVTDSDIYIIGGDLGNNAMPEHPLIIRRYDDRSFELLAEKTIEDTRTLSGGEIVDDILYVVGGQKPELGFYNNIIAYNLTNSSVSTIALPKGTGYCSAVRYENLIFISGRTVVGGNVDIFFGALDIRDNTFKEIPISIENKLASETFINGLTILNNVLYMAITDRRNENPFIEVQRTDLSGF